MTSQDVVASAFTFFPIRGERNCGGGVDMSSFTFAFLSITCPSLVSSDGGQVTVAV